jgi:hypothetical protein
MALNTGNVLLVDQQPTLIVPERADRHKLTILDLNNRDVRIGGPNVGFSNGFVIGQNLGGTIEYGRITIECAAAVYGFGGATNVRFIEEYGDGKHGGAQLQAYNVSGQGLLGPRIIASINSTRRQLFVQEDFQDVVITIGDDLVDETSFKLQLMDIVAYGEPILDGVSPRGWVMLRTKDEVLAYMSEDQGVNVLEIYD